MKRLTGYALTASLILLCGAGAGQAAVVLVEPGHTLNTLADSGFPSHPSQTLLDTACSANSDIESIGVDPSTGILYVQLRSAGTTCVFSVTPAGVVSVINPNTTLTINERGSDLHFNPATGLLLVQDARIFTPDRIATVNPAGGAVGTFALVDNIFGLGGATFGMDFSNGLGGGDVPAGQVIFTTDVAGNGIHSAAMGALIQTTHVTPPVAGDDMVVQPTGDWVHIPDFTGVITSYSPVPPHAATPSPSGLNISGIFAAAGLPFVFGSRATSCDVTGDIYLSYSGLGGGSGIFRVDPGLSTASHVLTITGEGLHDLTLGPATSGLGSSVYFTIHDPATNGEEVWEVTAPECACNADPRSQGYWHRQCLGVGLITPGRHGRGPAEAKEPDFLKTLVPAVNTRLQNSIFEFRTCEDGIDTVPPSEPCEKAKKQYTALLLNLESGRLAPGCGIDPASSSCTSSTIAGLIEEIAALINSGTDQNCKLAASCAGAANENDGILPFSATSSPVSSTGSGGLETPGGPVETTPDPGSGQIAGGAQAFSAAPEAAPSSSETRTTGTPEAASEPVYQEGGAGVGEIFLDTRIIEEAADRKTAQAEPAAEERAAPEPGSSRALLMHLSALSSRTSTPEQRRDAENALLTALGGGYEPAIRLQIVEQLIGKIDVAYNSLLARHLEDIRIDARESGDATLAEKAGRILERLEPSSGEEER